ncbi:hypothetical protein OsJ_17596 [Oryza sativa Japonica Group]|uniref:Uncharacterized protein n=1 Tax=Oryza sativa subsp. japonica TaxID=39947 RepID=B9FN63_ORYSJ|nr:hypothetical protein OsJ_17596 [Oryza sativa Japonica Group]
MAVAAAGSDGGGGPSAGWGSAAGGGGGGPSAYWGRVTMGQAGVGFDRNVALAPCILLCPKRRRANWVENVTHHVLAVHPGA